MLKTRVITALVLLAVFMPALFYLPAAGWAVFATLIAVLAAWEWGALMRLPSFPRILCGGGMAILCGALIVSMPAALGIDAHLESGFVGDARRLAQWVYPPAVVFWLLFAPLWMWRRWQLPASLAGMLIGVLLILPTWLALVQLRQAGPLVLLAVMALVWLADVAAYFSGRTLGKHKLAPTISPGKTWEGALGAVVAVLIYGLLLAPRLPADVSPAVGVLVPVLIVLTALSIVGDLFESLLKRQAGLKDSSRILPGHGGVLDRVDSLTSTLPLVACVWLFILH